jgi:lysophospholipid acyltransferase (LPLAT)-like uncharacterized protein
MHLGKRLVRSDVAQRLACWLVHLYVRLIWITSRWQVEGARNILDLYERREPAIVAFWHGRLLMLPLAWHGRSPFHMLISHHRDGRIIAGAVAYFGIGWIQGSSHDGGTAALRAILRKIRAGETVGITPDGPEGPAMRASRGIVAAARLSRAPIVPVTYATSRRRILGTWDRFHLGFPFSRGVFAWGEPIHVPSDLDEAGMESWRALVEARMNDLTAEADRLVGRDAVAPGTLTRSEWRLQRRAARTGSA